MHNALLRYEPPDRPTAHDATELDAGVDARVA